MADDRETPVMVRYSREMARFYHEKERTKVAAVALAQYGKEGGDVLLVLTTQYLGIHHGRNGEAKAEKIILLANIEGTRIQNEVPPGGSLQLTSKLHKDWSEPFAVPTDPTGLLKKIGPLHQHALRKRAQQDAQKPEASLREAGAKEETLRGE